MAMVALFLQRPSALVRGVCRNALLEPSANVFVGRLDLKRVKCLVDMLEKTRTNALVMVSAPRSALGVRVKSIGQLPDRHPVLVDGLNLIRRKATQVQSPDESSS